MDEQIETPGLPDASLPTMEMPTVELWSDSAGTNEPSPLVELFCWGLILAICGLLFFSQWQTQNSEAEKFDGMAEAMPEVRAVGFTTRLLIAQKNLGGLASAIDGESLNAGSLWQRYANSIQIAEIAGPAQALDFLDTVDDAVQAEAYTPDERQKAIRATLENVYRVREFSGPGEIAEFENKDAEILTKEFGWLGMLVLNPVAKNRDTDRPGIDDRANKMIFVLIGVGFVVILMFLASSICLPFAILFFVRGKFQSRLPDQAGSGSIYLEMFACWLLLTVLLVPLIVLAAGEMGLKLKDNMITIGFIAQLIPLVGAIVWPTLRGMSGARVMQDLGLSGHNPFAEIGAGIFGYICAVIPLAALLAIVQAMLFLTGGLEQGGLNSPPALHPAQELMMSGNVTTIVFILLTASVVAPLVEEIVFRGALYRYLRDRTGNQTRWTSVIIAILVSGILFSGIHPQNLVGLIPLTTLATFMALMRQWRSSLIASMTFHGLNNGVLMCMMLLMYL